MNTDEIRSLGALQVIGREAIAGALLKAMLGTSATVWAYLLQGRLYSSDRTSTTRQK